MILRVWHGYTNPESAGAYETLLKQEVFQGIERKKLRGFRGIELLRREVGSEVEFLTIMRFDRIEDVKAFTGDDYEAAYVPEAARKVLTRFDARSQHYELLELRQYPGKEASAQLATAAVTTAIDP